MLHPAMAKACRLAHGQSHGTSVVVSIRLSVVVQLTISLSMYNAFIAKILIKNIFILTRIFDCSDQKTGLYIVFRILKSVKNVRLIVGFHTFTFIFRNTGITFISRIIIPSHLAIIQCSEKILQHNLCYINNFILLRTHSIEFGRKSCYRNHHMTEQTIVTRELTVIFISLVIEVRYIIYGI